MNKRGMISAAAHSHLLVQPRSLVPLALPVDPAYSRCVQFFPGHSPKLPLYYFFRFKFLLIFSISISVSHLFVRICLAWSANLCSVTGKTPISSHIFFIPCLYFLFVISLLFQHSITICFTAFSHFILPFVWAVAWWRPAETGSGTPCMPVATPSQLVVPVPLTQLLLIPWFDISLYLRLCFMVFTNQCFYRDTISRKTATQSWRVLSTHEIDYPPPDANPVF